MADPVSAELLSSLTPAIIEALTDPLVRASWSPRLQITPRPAFDQRAFDALLARVFYRLEREIRYGYRPGSAPPIRRITLQYAEADEEFAVMLLTLDGLERSFRVPKEWLRLDVLEAVGFPAICARYFDGAAENFNNPRFDGRHFDWHADVQLRNMIADARSGRPPAPSIDEDFRFRGVDPAGGDESFTVVTPAPALTITNVCTSNNVGAGFLLGADTAAAEARGQKLLKEWLSPAQLDQYERTQAFDVTGQSGRRYRIKYGSVLNVFELDADGCEICGWCFAPEGDLVIGDVMLAQKVALETSERAALKVANRFGGPESMWGNFYWERLPTFGEAHTRSDRAIVTGNPITVDSRSWTGLA